MQEDKALHIKLKFSDDDDSIYLSIEEQSESGANRSKLGKIFLYFGSIFRSDSFKMWIITVPMVWLVLQIYACTITQPSITEMQLARIDTELVNRFQQMQRILGVNRNLTCSSVKSILNGPPNEGATSNNLSIRSTLSEFSVRTTIDILYERDRLSADDVAELELLHASLVDVADNCADDIIPAMGEFTQRFQEN